LRDAAHPNERAETKRSCYSAPSRIARGKQESERDEREGECGVTGNERTVAIALGCEQRRRRELMGSAKLF